MRDFRGPGRGCPGSVGDDRGYAAVVECRDGAFRGAVGAGHCDAECSGVGSGFGNVFHLDIAFPLNVRPGIDKAQVLLQTEASF